MEGSLLTVEGGKPQKRVRFRVASGNSGRVLKEMFKDDGPSDSLDSDCTSSSEVERASTPSTSGETNGHIAVFLGSELDDSESEPDDLLLYAGAKDKDRVFSTKRVNILSKNGTVRGVKHKVSAGQIVFDNMTKVTEVSAKKLHRQQSRSPAGTLNHLDMFSLQLFYRICNAYRKKFHFLQRYFFKKHLSQLSL